MGGSFATAQAPQNWFFVGPAPFHVPEGALPLHFFLEHPQGRIDVVIAHEDLHDRDALSKG